jgi:hypothetical protein
MLKKDVIKTQTNLKVDYYIVEQHLGSRKCCCVYTFLSLKKKDIRFCSSTLLLLSMHICTTANILNERQESNTKLTVIRDGIGESRGDVSKASI